MKTLIVANQASGCPMHSAFATMVSAQDYLTDIRFRDAEHVINVCDPITYQSKGYYVSLIAQARQQHPLPDVKTIEDLHSDALLHVLLDKLDRPIQSALANVDETHFTLNLYFGQDPQHKLSQLGQQIFALLPVPMVQIKFHRQPDCLPHWQVEAVTFLSLQDIPEQHWPYLQQALDKFMLHKYWPRKTEIQCCHEVHHPAIAILYDPNCQEPPSNAHAINKFQQAAVTLGMKAEVISKDDAPRLHEFDALFIRDTTNINHYTYLFSRSAAVDGLVVMDDPDSILQCTNKVYLNELFQTHHLPVPKTLVVHRDNIDQVIPSLGLPCILKQPDGAFSLGVVKIHSEQQLVTVAEQFLQKSDLILAQQYLPTSFDWRIGVLDRQPLFACKYFMAPGHWQVIKRQQDRKLSEGQTSAVPLSRVPAFVLKTALAAADLIGDGFYGVDLKQNGQQCFIIEINDNPNVDMGNEDGVLHDALYRQVMQVFHKRIANLAWNKAR